MNFLKYLLITIPDEIEIKILKLSEQRKKIENDIAELELILDKSSKAGHRYNEKIKLIKDVMHEDYTISQLKGDAKKLRCCRFCIRNTFLE